LHGTVLLQAGSESADYSIHTYPYPVVEVCATSSSVIMPSLQKVSDCTT